MLIALLTVTAPYDARMSCDDEEIVAIRHPAAAPNCEINFTRIPAQAAHSVELAAPESSP
ncbi:MAG: hypothetical protein DWQ34_19225 [Planctomycetota bacterium]|nr:MAG: hypothetical protein DWQ29_11990 [Planctomycetota bacterium]REJ89653.1 MAG: hypothetical protein DWQ34_19225 [Planctomycetota bacterium]REK24364.1 MAG: hypothetical protein DWQ41_15195 [Planctomycetota bacterium]REK38555.1 MAG: hypothetical protein DWQ45_03990 [Planctomycetota bacterium]